MMSFGQFLFSQYYQMQGKLGVQLQMTRYAAGATYVLFGFSLVIWETLEILINARSS